MKVQQLKSTVQDNYGNTYNIFLDKTTDKPVIRVKGQVITHNGGSWYLETLLENKSNRLYIDYGQEWFVSGMKAVYNEIETMEKNA